MLITGQSVYQAINQVRVEQHLNALSPDVVLVKVANAKAQDMVKWNYFAHRSPRGKNVWSFAGGCKCSVLGENLAKNYSTIESLENAWLVSRGHRENILWRGYRKTGIGIATAKDGTVYVVQIFSN